MHFHLILFYIFFIFLLDSHSIYFTFSVHFNVSLRSRTCIMICTQNRIVCLVFRVFHCNFGLFTLAWCRAFSYLLLSSADSQSRLDFTIDFSTSSNLMRGNFPVKKARKEYGARVTASDETEYRKIHNNH